MTTAKFDMAVALSNIDRLGRRSVLRTSNRYYARCLESYRRGSSKIRDEDLWAYVNLSLMRAMSAAHVKARQMYSAHRRVALAIQDKPDDRNEIRRLLRQAPRDEKRAIDSFYAKIAKSVTNKTMAKVRDRLLGDVADIVNRKPRAYKKEIRSTLQKIGISHDAGNLVETTIRTQSALAFNAAAWTESLDPELWGYEYSTAGDERVRKSHVALDGTRYPKDHAFWKKYAPPNGWNCRCTLNPIYAGDRDAHTVAFSGTPDVDPEFLFNPGGIFLAA